MNQRNGASRPIWSRYGRELLALALLVFIVHDIFGAHGFLAMQRAHKQIEQTRTEVDRLNQENNDLGGQVQSLKTDPKAIERIAREEMGLARPGEMIFKLPPQADSSAEPDARK